MRALARAWAIAGRAAPLINEESRYVIADSETCLHHSVYTVDSVICTPCPLRSPLFLPFLHFFSRPQPKGWPLSRVILHAVSRIYVYAEQHAVPRWAPSPRVATRSTRCRQLDQQGPRSLASRKPVQTLAYAYGFKLHEREHLRMHENSRAVYMCVRSTALAYAFIPVAVMHCAVCPAG